MNAFDWPCIGLIRPLFVVKVFLVLSELTKACCGWLSLLPRAHAQGGKVIGRVVVVVVVVVVVSTKIAISRGLGT